jgi:translation initiation factor IF-2
MLRTSSTLGAVLRCTRPLSSTPAVHAKKVKTLTIPRFTTVSALANILGVRYEKLLLRLEEMGFEDLAHNFIMDQETAGLIADEYGYEVNFVEEKEGEDLRPMAVPDDKSNWKTRPPIVTIMGHVDHGKTTILDHLRKSSIVDQEHGGITQHIGAFSVKTPITKKQITFLDTPGHAAFLKMRQRGADMTDIVILVVAADDSVMPQTKEAIRHIKQSGVPVIVAVNKCDKENANPERVIADLANNEIDVEDYGGETQTVRVSGLTGLNMDKLEESIITLSEVLELKAPENRAPVEGWIIESQSKKGMGPLATVLVRQGILKKGDILVAGKTYCKVRAMKDEHGKSVKQATPAMPVEIWGWKEVPEAGDECLQAKDESQAKKVIETRLLREGRSKQAQDIDVINKLRLNAKKIMEERDRLDELRKYGLAEEDVSEPQAEIATQKNVNYIIRADVSGSVEAIVESIKDIGNDEVKLTVLTQAVGSPTESDLERAQISGAKILCFNMKVPKDIENKAAKMGVEIKLHNVIYHLIEEVTADLSSKLEPTIELKVRAEAELREIFEIKGKRKKVFKIAGCKVTSGALERNSPIRVMRNEKEVYRGRFETMKHLKDDVQEIKKGKDCGLSFENWSDFKPGDVIQAYDEHEIPRYL